MNLTFSMFDRRPRILNLLHALHLAQPCSQTIESELLALASHAKGKRVALEIGTFQGVSAVRIVRALAHGGLLYCVDPWPETDGKPNSCWSITERHFKRSKVGNAVRIIREFSTNAQELIPADLDFAFIDGDHSRAGIETDWRIVAPRIQSGGILCLHDAITPPSEPYRVLGSTQFFSEVASKDPAFELVETVHSLAVLRKR